MIAVCALVGTTGNDISFFGVGKVVGNLFPQFGSGSEGDDFDLRLKQSRQ